MKALILNSGVGNRMGKLTGHAPKCMVQIAPGQTILSRQLALLWQAGMKEFVITTGPFAVMLETHAREVLPQASFVFVNNPQYSTTNYIHSIWLAQEFLQDDILLLHGDLVFDQALPAQLLAQADSVMTVSTTQPLPQKDFKAVLAAERIQAVGIDFFEQALAAQPFYSLKQADWLVWLEEIIRFCQRGERSCYAENAFNQVSDRCRILPFDVRDRLCGEVDTPKDLQTVTALLQCQ